MHDMRVFIASAGAAFSLSAIGLAVADPVGPSSPVVQYQAPVTPARMLNAFEPPPSPYAAAHRGVDLAVPVAAAVRSAGPGVVTFAGNVAGRGVIVISHPDGISTEYEPVGPVVRKGQHVDAGTVIGHQSGQHTGCVASCLHWGARRNGDYLDPMSLLRPLGVVRLLPWDGPSSMP